jgi:cytidine deaminase
LSKTKKLFTEATQVRRNAYAPYSKFKVGSALVDNRGKVFAGCNYENSSYGATICAERNALGTMLADGGTHFKEILIVTDTPKGCPPCGMCLQVMAEFSANPSETIVHLATTKAIMLSVRLSELLPIAFDSGYFKTRKRNPH